MSDSDSDYDVLVQGIDDNFSVNLTSLPPDVGVAYSERLKISLQPEFPAHGSAAEPNIAAFAKPSSALETELYGVVPQSWKTLDVKFGVDGITRPFAPVVTRGTLELVGSDINLGANNDDNRQSPNDGEVAQSSLFDEPVHVVRPPPSSLLLRRFVAGPINSCAAPWVFRHALKFEPANVRHRTGAKIYECIVTDPGSPPTNELVVKVRADGTEQRLAQAPAHLELSRGSVINILRIVIDQRQAGRRTGYFLVEPSARYLGDDEYAASLAPATLCAAPTRDGTLAPTPTDAFYVICLLRTPSSGPSVDPSSVHLRDRVHGMLSESDTLTFSMAPRPSTLTFVAFSEAYLPRGAVVRPRNVPSPSPRCAEGSDWRAAYYGGEGDTFGSSLVLTRHLDVIVANDPSGHGLPHAIAQVRYLDEIYCAAGRAPAWCGAPPEAQPSLAPRVMHLGRNEISHLREKGASLGFRIGEAPPAPISAPFDRAIVRKRARDGSAVSGRLRDDYVATGSLDDVVGYVRQAVDVFTRSLIERAIAASSRRCDAATAEPPAVAHAHGEALAHGDDVEHKVTTGLGGGGAVNAGATAAATPMTSQLVISRADVLRAVAGDTRLPRLRRAQRAFGLPARFKVGTVDIEDINDLRVRLLPTPQPPRPVPASLPAAPPPASAVPSEVNLLDTKPIA